MSPACRARRGGFTLLELLVVVTIMAFATAGVSLALRDSAAVQLEREAQRLVVLLEVARAQSRVAHAPVRWRSTGSGFVFDGLNQPAGEWLQPGTRAQSDQGGPAPVLMLGPEPLIGAQSLVLSHGGLTRRIGSDGLRPFQVLP